MRSGLPIKDDPSVAFVVQEPQLGTGHALLQALPELGGATGDILLLYGDVPLLSATTVAELLARHRDDQAAATVLTAEVDQPFGYGRIVRQDGAIARIVEERDATPAERAIKEINAGIYVLALEPLAEAMAALAPQNAQGEYYLPDLIGIYRRRGLGVSTLTVRSADEIRGVNSRRELAEVSRLVRNAKNEELLAAGVTLIDPATTYVEADVEVGADTVIHPNVYLEGRTRIGVACEIHAGTRLVNATVGDRVTIRNYCVITDSTVESDAMLGPFAHLRPGSVVQKRGPRRQFRRAEEGHAGPEIEGQSPHVSGRRDDWRGRQHRRRHDHLQLRRQTEAPDRHRRRRLHRQRFATHRAGHDWQRRLRRGRLLHHRRCARRRAGHHARAAGEQGGVGGGSGSKCWVLGARC